MKIRSYSENWRRVAVVIVSWVSRLTTISFITTMAPINCLCIQLRTSPPHGRRRFVFSLQARNIMVPDWLCCSYPYYYIKGSNWVYRWVRRRVDWKKLVSPWRPSYSGGSKNMWCISIYYIPQWTGWGRIYMSNITINPIIISASIRHRLWSAGWLWCMWFCDMVLVPYGRYRSSTLQRLRTVWPVYSTNGHILSSIPK